MRASVEPNGRDGQPGWMSIQDQIWVCGTSDLDGDSELQRYYWYNHQGEITMEKPNVY